MKMRMRFPAACSSRRYNLFREPHWRCSWSRSILRSECWSSQIRFGRWIGKSFSWYSVGLT